MKSIIKSLFRNTSYKIGLLLGMSATSFFAYSAELEEIIVTAQKREQSLQNIGVNVTAITGSELEELGIEDVSDMMQFVSNIDIKAPVGGANQTITIRGVGLNDFNSNNNPTVGVYVDEVFATSPALLGFQLFDIERVEVLKGPQGTLYGRNTTGGAVNYITRKPTDEFSAYVNASYGNYEASVVEGAINGALTENLAARVALKVNHQGESYWDNRRTGNDLGSSDEWAIRTSFRLNANDALTVNLSAHYSDQDTSSMAYETFGLIDPAFQANATAIMNATLGPLGIPPLPPEFAPGFIINAVNFGVNPFCAPVNAGIKDNTACVDAFGSSDTDDEDFEVGLAEQSFYDAQQFGATLKFDLELGDDTTFTSITGYETLDRNFGDPVNGNSAFSLLTNDRENELDQYSQEFRLTGTSGELDWIVGAFYSYDKVVTRVNYKSDDMYLTRWLIAYDQKTESAAGFVHTEWNWAPEWSLILGLRYTWEEKEYVGSTTDLDPFGMSWMQLAGFPLVQASQDETIDVTEFSGKIGVEYRPNDEWLYYASISRGFKSGGFFGDIAFDPLELEPFDEETLLAYEVGFKGRLFDSSLQWNASLFYYDYSDVQAVVASTIAFRLDNIEEGEIYGLDMDVWWRPVDGLDIKAGVGLLETELGEFATLDSTFAFVQIPEGNEFSDSPKVTFTGLVRYEWPIGDNLLASVQSNIRYSDTAHRSSENDPLNESDDYVNVNASLSIASDDGKWSISLWGKNLTDDVHTQTSYTVGTLSVGYDLMNNPRTYGVAVSYNLK